MKLRLHVLILSLGILQPLWAQESESDSENETKEFTGPSETPSYRYNRETGNFEFKSHHRPELNVNRDLMRESRISEFALTAGTLDLMAPELRFETHSTSRFKLLETSKLGQNALRGLRFSHLSVRASLTTNALVEYFNDPFRDPYAIYMTITYEDFLALQKKTKPSNQNQPPGDWVEVDLTNWSPPEPEIMPAKPVTTPNVAESPSNPTKYSSPTEKLSQVSVLETTPKHEENSTPNTQGILNESSGSKIEVTSSTPRLQPGSSPGRSPEFRSSNAGSTLSNFGSLQNLDIDSILCEGSAAGVAASSEDLKKITALAESQAVESLGRPLPKIDLARTAPLALPGMTDDEAWQEYLDTLATPEIEGIELNPALIIRQIAATRGRLKDFDNLEIEVRPGQKLSRIIAEAFVDGAEEALSQNDLQSSARLNKLAIMATDIALDLHPVTGPFKGAAEALTGRNYVTGDQLAGWERALAAASILPFGALLKYVHRGVKTAKGARAAKGLAKIDAPSAPKLGGNRSLQLGPEQLQNEAKRLGISPKVLLERRNTAIDFYSRHPFFQNPANFRFIEDHLRGIDFSRPVRVVDIPAGTLIEQWQSIPQHYIYKTPGNYFGKPGSSPSRLGIDDLEWVDKKADWPKDWEWVKDLDDNTFSAKFPVQYRTTKNTQALESYAKDMNVDFARRPPVIRAAGPGVDQNALERYTYLRQKQWKANVNENQYTGLNAQERFELNELTEKLDVIEGEYAPGGAIQYFLDPSTLEMVD